MRPLGAAFAGIVVAAAIVGLVAFGQQATAKPQTATAPSVAVSAPVLHDRGLATAPSVAVSAPVLHDRGLATAPSVASADSPSRSSGGSNGTRFRK
jgi:hypothetical protein